MRQFRTLFFILLIVSFLLTPCLVAESSHIAEIPVGIHEYHGYYTFYWDSKGVRIWLLVDKLETEFLYFNSLPAGVGSNDIGLDRGQLGQSRVVKFERSGPRLLLVQPNYAY